jgi:hypothetical protein
VPSVRQAEASILAALSLSKNLPEVEPVPLGHEQRVILRSLSPAGIPSILSFLINIEAGDLVDQGPDLANHFDPFVSH